ncbi:MAG: transcription termination/antitermination protein NusA [Deltaproteobacteria bacterium]|nr:transcription termination/antitermination protein NusA [Deltaproteobacteria bacterium]
MILDVGQIIAQLGKEKGIDKGIIIDAIKEALESAARKKFGMNKIIEATYDPETGEFEILAFRTVVTELTDPDTQMTLAEALELDPEAQVGDSLGDRLSTKDLGRIAAQTARQIIMQKVKDAEREVIYNEFIGRKGEIINGIVQRYERDCLVIDMGKTEAIMPPSEQIPRERYRQSDRIRAYIKDVTKTSRGPEILLSRSDPRMILKLFEQEVPEVYEGVVSILSVAREPGFRTKIAVRSKDRDVDPVGACVGMKGSRVQSVVQELRGERIDIIAWDEDPAKFVCNALQPAEIIRVLVNESEKTMEEGAERQARLQARRVAHRGAGRGAGRGRPETSRGTVREEAGSPLRSFSGGRYGSEGGRSIGSSPGGRYRFDRGRALRSGFGGRRCRGGGGEGGRCPPEGVAHRPCAPASSAGRARRRGGSCGSREGPAPGGLRIPRGRCRGGGSTFAGTANASRVSRRGYERRRAAPAGRWAPGAEGWPTA